MRKALLTALLLGACAAVPAGLTPSAWEVVDIAGRQLADDTEVTIEFAEGRVSGRSGCNRYTGPVELGEGVIDVGLLAVTRMACPGEAGAIEAAFLDTIGRVDRFSIVRGELVLGAQGRTVMRARRR